MKPDLLSRCEPLSPNTNPRIRQNHLLEPPAPPSPRQACITEEIDAIELCALAKDPAHRFTSMAEMGAAIDAVGTGQSVVSLLERRTLPLLASPMLAERSKIIARREGAGSGRDEAKFEPSPKRSAVAPTLAIPADRAPESPGSGQSAASAGETQAVRGRGALAITLLGVAGVAGVVAILFAFGVLDERMDEAKPATVLAPAPAPAPGPTLLQFETNVPVVVTDLDGRTPFGEQPTRAVSIPRSDEPMRLVLRADGFRELHVVVTPNHDQIFAAQLEPLPESSPDPTADPAADAADSPPAVEPELPTRERPRAKKPATEQAEQAEPPPTHSFSPEIRDPFGNVQK
jgi:serine/threonine-protein kinase